MNSQISDALLSVVIVSWNSKGYLEKCLSSLRKNSKLKSEIIVVDNNSDDETVAWIEASYPEIKVMALDENLGFSKGCNLGAQEASGRYLFFLNPDTTVLENSLDSLVETLESDDTVVAIAPKLINEDGSHQHSVRHFPSLWDECCQEFMLSAFFPNSQIFARYYMAHQSPQERSFVDVVTGAAFLVRREVFEKLKGFDERLSFMYYEDIDFCWRLKSEGFKLVYDPSVRIEHSGGASSKLVSQKSRLYLLEARFNYHRKQSGSLAIVLLWILHFLSGLFFSLVTSFMILFGVRKESARRINQIYRSNLRCLLNFHS